jgi:glycogen(starch) synthase
VTRVLVLSNLYPPHSLGGYEGACRDVVERFRRRGHEVEVLTSSYGLGTKRPATAEAHVHRTLRLTSTFVPSPPMVRRPAVERANLRTLRRRLDVFRPDVVSVWNMSGLSLSLLPAVWDSGIPLVFVVCDGWPVGCTERDAWMAPFIKRPRLGSAVSRLTGMATRLDGLGSMGSFGFASAWLQGWCEGETGWTFRDTGVFHLGVDLDDFPLVERGPDVGFSGRLLFVGRLDPSKGVPTLLRALARLPHSMVLDVVGPGDVEQQRVLDELVRELGLQGRVHFGTERREALAARYRASDAVVFPSEWDEPFGIVPLEAMACAVPVVATGTGGSAEFLRDEENCLLFPRGNADALAAAVARLASDGELRRRLVEGGTATAAALTSDALADGLEQFHVSAARGSG